jgi:hypothetical protein
MKLFSQTAYALTIPEFTESAGENLLLYRTDLGLVTNTQCTSTLQGPNRGPLTASNLYMVIDEVERKWQLISRDWVIRIGRTT